MKIDQNMLGKFLNFVQKSNIETTGGSDYSIVNNTIRSFGQERFPTIDELAEQSTIAKSSVTRFVKKHGFNDYREFRTVMESGRKILYQNLEFLFLNNSDSKDVHEINDVIYNSVLDNLNATRNNLNMGMIMKIVQLLKNAKDVTFVGANHDVEEFLMLQISLMTAGIPAYSFRSDQASSLHCNFIGEDSVVLFINIADHFFNSHEILQQCQNKNAKTVFLTQDDNPKREDIFDIYYRYGVPDSLHNGYASLTYLSRLLMDYFLLANITNK